jgi:hypothetical protein
MTEPEYVKLLRDAAQAYVDWLPVFSGSQGSACIGNTPVLEWHHAKMQLSPFTLLELCEFWLKHNPDAAEIEYGATEN